MKDNIKYVIVFILGMLFINGGNNILGGLLTIGSAWLLFCEFIKNK